MHRQESLVEKRWNAEYGRGRYSGEAPVEMITRILAAARARNLPAGCLQRGTVQDLAPGISFPLVIGIQVFQHGTGAAAAAHIRAAGARVSPGGIFAIRVNAAGTDVHPAHRVIEEKDGAFTVEYLDGPKRGLDIHFFSGPELSGLLESAGFDEIESLRQVTHERLSPQTGSWRQWEGIWKARS